MTQTRDVRSVWSRFYIYDLDLDTLVEALGPEGFPKRLAPPGGDPHSATLRIAVDSTISEIDHASGVVIKQESWPYQASHLYVESSDRWYSFDRYSEEIRAVRTLEPADVRVFDLNGIRMCPGERLGTFWTLFHDGRLELGNVKTGVVEKQFQLWPNSEEWDIGSVFKVVGDTLVIAMVRNSFDPSVEFSLIMQTVDGSDPLRSYPITVPTPEAEVSGQVDYSPRLGAAAMITHDADSVYLHLIPVEGTARVVALGGFDRVLHELGGHQVRFALDDSVICVHHVKDSVIVIVDSKTLKTLPGPEMRWRSPVVFDVVDSGRRLVYSYRVPIDNYNVVDLSTMETSSEYLGGGGLIQPLYDGRHLMRLRPNFFGIESAAIIDVMSGEQVKELWLSQFKPSVVGGFPFEQPLYSGSVQDTVLYAWGSAFFFLDDGVEYSNKVLNVDGPAELRPIGDQRDFAVFPQNSTRAGIVDPMFRSVITRLSLMNKEQPETMLKSSDGRWIAQRVATPTKVSALRLYRYDTSLDGDGDVPGYQVGRQVEVEGPLVLLSLDLSRTQPVCVYATGDGVVIKLDLRGQFIGRDTLVRSLTAPVSVYIAPNGRTVAILSLGQLQFVDLASNQELVTYRMPRILHGFHWGTDGRSFYLGHDYVEYSKYSLDSIVSATESNVDTKICDESVQIVQSGSKIDVYSGQYDGNLTIVDLLGRVIVTQRPVRMGEHTQVHLGSQSSGQLYVLFEGDACTTVRTLLNIR